SAEQHGAGGDQRQQLERGHSGRDDRGGAPGPNGLERDCVLHRVRRVRYPAAASCKPSHVSRSPSSRDCSARQPSSRAASPGSVTLRWISPGRASAYTGSPSIPVACLQTAWSSLTEVSTPVPMLETPPSCSAAASTPRTTSPT